MRLSRRTVLPVPSRSAFAGYRFPPEVIVLAVRWYLRFGLSYRDVEELLAERGIEVVQRPPPPQGQMGVGSSRCLIGRQPVFGLAAAGRVTLPSIECASSWSGIQRAYTSSVIW
jgi:hypothetical protein